MKKQIQSTIGLVIILYCIPSHAAHTVLHSIAEEYRYDVTKIIGLLNAAQIGDLDKKNDQDMTPLQLAELYSRKDFPHKPETKTVGHALLLEFHAGQEQQLRAMAREIGAIKAAQAMAKPLNVK